MNKFFTCCILLSAMFFCPVRATIIYTSLSQDSLTIGDKIHYTVSLVVPSGAQIVPPDADRSFGPLTVKQWNLNKVAQKRSDSLAYNYVITTYTAEPCTIPALSFIQTFKGQTDTISAPAKIVRVVSVLPMSDTVAIKDIKPLVNAGKPSLLWMWILISAVVIMATILLIRRFVHAKINVPPPLPPKPPYQEAIEALALLMAKGYLEKGMVREYIFELSEIFKRYIGRRFDSNVAEYTTEEIIAWLIKSPFDEKLRKNVEWFFKATDPVKFAKMLPERETLETMKNEVITFLEATKPIMEMKS